MRLAVLRSIPPFCMLALGVSIAAAADSGVAQVASDLSELSLQELTNLKVTTLAKRPQRAADVAAALFVITQDDIRRSGATSIPEALRLAPGLQVAQIDGAKWAISARGFSGRFANKLLVLMDGRTLYTPSFGGVHWDAHDTIIDDIERIEVIRGPAGTTWGSNAVNGIINIITKRAGQTDGLLVSTDAGADGSAALNVRFGEADGGVAQWRVYAKAFERDANEQLNGADAYDESHQERIGARLETNLEGGHSLRTAVEAYQGYSGDSFTGSYLRPIADPYAPHLPAREHMDGVWATAGWSRQLGPDSHVELQTYFDHEMRRGPVFDERNETADLDFQHVLPRWGVHTLTWGAGVRYSRDRLITFSDVQVNPPADSFWLSSAYVQDEINLFADRFTLAAGARIEDSNIGDRAVLPNLRGRVALSERTAVWAAVARGVRRPSRAEHDIVVPALMDPLPANTPENPLPLPVRVAMYGAESFGSEKLTAYEAGWRWQAADELSFDLALFYNAYDDLRSGLALPPECFPGGETVADNPACLFYSTEVVVRTALANSSEGHARGGEVTAIWAPQRYWRIAASYARLQKNLRDVLPHESVLLFMLGQDPENEYSLRSTLSIGPGWDWDLFVKHRDDIDSIGLPAATQLDARLAWRPALDLEVALVGRNLLSDAKVQAVTELFDLGYVAIERTGYVQLRWSFR